MAVHEFLAWEQMKKKPYLTIAITFFLYDLWEKIGENYKTGTNSRIFIHAYLISEIIKGSYTSPEQEKIASVWLSGISFN